MKLFLMRHAEAEGAGEKSDISRNLTENGRNQALIATNKLLNQNISKILVSSANRTQQTAEIVMSKIKCSNFEILPELYGSSSDEILKIISVQNNDDKNLLVIAHNPGIFKTALKLTDSNSEQYDILLANGMPPANIIILDFPEISSWREIESM